MADTTESALASFEPGVRALVFGASGGIGAALVRRLRADPRVERVFAAARRPAPALPATNAAAEAGGAVAEAGGAVAEAGGAAAGPGRGCAVEPLAFDLADEVSIARAVESASADGPLHLVIVATGLLHVPGGMAPERSWRALDAAALAQAFAINTIGPALIAKHALGRMAPTGKSVLALLSARVGSIADNRRGGWHGYRASKAALNMLVRNFAHELALRRQPTLCVALHPGTVDSALSRPFQAGVPPAQLFTPEQAATHLLAVIEGLGPEESGAFLAWDGARIPF